MPFAQYRLSLLGRQGARGILERRQCLELRAAQSRQLLKVWKQRTPFRVVPRQKPGRHLIEWRFSPIFQMGHWSQRLEQRISVQLKKKIGVRRGRSRPCAPAAWKTDVPGGVERQILEDGRPPGFKPSTRPVA